MSGLNEAAAERVRRRGLTWSIYPSSPCVPAPGSVVMSIFVMVMIGGGIVFIDDSRDPTRGTSSPIKRLELIAGTTHFRDHQGGAGGICAVTIRARSPASPTRRSVRMFRMTVKYRNTALAGRHVPDHDRVSDPVARAIFGVLNTLLCFPQRRGHHNRRSPAG